MAEIVKRVNDAKKSINSIKKKIQQLKINIPLKASGPPVTATSNDRELYRYMINSITRLRRQIIPTWDEGTMQWRWCLWLLHSVLAGTRQNPSQESRVLALNDPTIRVHLQRITDLINITDDNTRLDSQVVWPQGDFNGMIFRQRRYNNRRNFVLNIFDLIDRTIRLRGGNEASVFAFFLNGGVLPPRADIDNFRFFLDNMN